ncbi:MAG: dTMP kinase [Sphingomonadaceae bacterium]|nr:dTMP kinase [Sphingomonadaceae bacterium]
MSGRLIAFEGGEGTGKTTQARLLAERLRSAGHEVVLTREPGGTPEAEAIRGLLLGGSWTPVTEALLVNAARAEHVERLIRPAIERGAWVVVDRYVDSTLAYQGAGRGLPTERLRLLHEIATGGLWPDRVILLDLPTDAALARAKGRGDANRFEDEADSFHVRVRRGFSALAEAAPDRYALIESGGSVEDTAERVWASLADLLSQS